MYSLEYNVLRDFYAISIHSLFLLKRNDFNYKKLSSRSVFVVNDCYILKRITQSEGGKDLNYIFKFLNEKSCKNVILPILNTKNSFVSCFHGSIYVLFDKKSLKKSEDIAGILYDYMEFFSLLQDMDVKYLRSSHTSYIGFLTLLKNKKFIFLLSKFHILYDEFRSAIGYYMRHKRTAIIYATFWEENIYLLNKQNVFIDLDSIQEGDPFYDMCFVLLYIFLKIKDQKLRYKYYFEIYSFYCDMFGGVNERYMQGLLYYFCFFIFKDINERDEATLLRHVFLNFEFMRDFLYFYHKEYDF